MKVRGSWFIVIGYEFRKEGFLQFGVRSDEFGVTEPQEEGF